MPSLEGVSTWVNGDAPVGEDLAGKPVLVHFWSISCYLCHNVAEEVAKWQAEYGPQGLAVIGVHQPRGPGELDVATVAADARGPMAITWPNAVDNEHALVQRFENQFVPAYYVFDKGHKLVHRQAGDRGFERLHDKIGELLSDKALV
ncbi:MAG: TlpA disulfide reductase family protein [Candidatus Elarobacter sp.]